MESKGCVRVSAKLQGARRSLTHLSKDAWDLKEVLRTMPLESL